MADDDDDNEEEKKFAERVNKYVHKALTERDGRLERTMVKKFETMLGSKFDELRTMLASADDDLENPDLDETPQGAPTGGAGAGQGLSPEARARLMRVEREAKEAKDAANRFQQEAEKERSIRVRAEERQTLQQMLGPFVKPKMLDIAVDQLHTKNLVREEETGTMLWRSDDGTTLPLKDGIAMWAKSDVGKEFAPPVEARGRGGRGPEGPNGIQPGKMTVEDIGSIVTGSIPGMRSGS